MAPTPNLPPRPDLSSHELGSYSAGHPGPVVVVTGGMHGNEPAGVLAIQQVLGELEQRAAPVRGKVIGLAGNLAALRSGARFLDRDLNRMWGRGEMEALPASGTDVHETEERAALHALIEAAIAGAREPVVFLDLHSTSAGGSPFSIIGDTLQNRRIASTLPVPLILGLEENVEGALLGFFGERGHIAVGFEGGQHDAPSTIHHHIAAIWLTLIAAGALEQQQVVDAKAHFDVLREVGRGHPGVVEMRYRHHVDEIDKFQMNEGYANFDAVERGELLARDAEGEIASPESGFILLPLYQGQGQDGFFIGREVRRFWLRVSAGLRWLRLGYLAPWLPGIREVSGEPGTLEVDLRIARWGVVQVFHLLGYRRVREVPGALRFTRRVEGLHG